jgi:hypothetical protein
MKRNLSDVQGEDEPKRSKLQLTFYASGKHRAIKALIALFDRQRHVFSIAERIEHHNTPLLQASSL